MAGTLKSKKEVAPSVPASSVVKKKEPILKDDINKFNLLKRNFFRCENLWVGWYRVERKN